MPVNNSVGSRIQQSAQRSFMYAAQNALSQVIRNMFGYNVFGRVASDVTRQTMYATMNNSNRNLSAAEQQQAVIQAFKAYHRNLHGTRVEIHLYLHLRYKRRCLHSIFNFQQAPITHNYDKMIPCTNACTDGDGRWNNQRRRRILLIGFS